MHWFKHLKIRKKLGLGFGAVLLLMVGMSMFSLVELSRVNGATVDLATHWMPSLRMLASIRYHTLTLRRRQLSLLLADAKEMGSWKRKIDGMNQQLLDDFKKYEVLVSSSEEGQIYQEYRSNLDRFLAVQSEVLRLAEAGKRSEAVKLSQGNGLLLIDAALDKLEEDIQLNVNGGKASAARAAVAYSAARSWVVTLLAGAILLTVLFTIAITRSISLPVLQTMTALESVANRDLTRTINVESSDELGIMGDSLNRTIEALRSTLTTISQSAEQLARASQEISMGAGQTAESSRVQSDQSTHVATAMQEMGTTVQEISMNSHRASTASRGAADAARNGGKVVEETLATMRSISDSTERAASTMTELGKSSERIGHIISVIDDIADQTNLLALNAAIEAARAGEQGRGFAVVADEVRKLAERTTNATKEITGMIESIQKETRSAVTAMQQGSAEVQRGVEKTSASGTALAEIIKMSENVGDMIATIASAATQQSAASEEINASVTHISSSAQSASSASDQTAKACTELSTLAFELQRLVSQFKLDSNSHPTVLDGDRMERDQMKAARKSGLSKSASAGA